MKSLFTNQIITISCEIYYRDRQVFYRMDFFVYRVSFADSMAYIRHHRRFGFSGTADLGRLHQRLWLGGA